MGIVKRLIAVYLILTAAAVALLLAGTPLIHDGSEEYPLWQMLNWFMAAGVVIAVVANVWRWMERDPNETNAVEYLRVAFSFYGVIVLAVIFCWNWFWTLNPESETGGAVTSHLIYFPMMDMLYVIIAFGVARRLWKSSDEAA